MGQISHRRIASRQRLRTLLWLAGIAVASAAFFASRQPNAIAVPELMHAEALMKQGRLQEGMALLETYARSQPESAAGEFHLGRALRQSGALGKAASRLQRAQELGWNAEAVAFERQLAALQAGQPGISIESLAQRLPDADPRHADIYEAATLNAMERQELDTALRLTHRWLELDPHSVRALLIRAYGFEVGQQWKQAEADYRSILKQDPENASASRGLGKVLLELSQPDEARLRFEFCLRENPADLAATAGLARALLALGRADQAVDLLTGAVRAQPRDSELLLLLGKLQYERGDYAAAEKSLYSAIQFNPTHIEAHYQLSQVLVRLGAAERAAQHAEKVRDLRARRSRIRQIQEQLAGDPGNVGIRYEAATLLMEAGSVNEGLMWLNSVLTYDPAHPGANLMLAEHFETLGNLPRAQVHRRRAGSTQPGALK